MITKLHLKDFRGIAESDIEIGPMTILTGANNTGKSTLAYALLVLKNIVSNPNQPLDSFFNLQFLNLGGFKEAVHRKDEDSRRIGIGIQSAGKAGESSYQVALGKAKSTLAFRQVSPPEFHLRLDVTFPYALNQQTGTVLDGDFKVIWNGVTATIASEQAGREDDMTRMSHAIGAPVEDIKGIDFVPLKRGFSKPVFSPVPLQAQLITEDEIATFVANDRDLEGAVNLYLERIVNKNFQVRPTLGTSNFYLHTIDRASGFVCDLVNDGFGTNQLVYLLTKALRKGQSLICIEEPEIHLHPSALSKLVDVLVEVSRDRGRRFLLSTHSEPFVLSLLNKVARRSLAPDDVRLYFFSKERAQTCIERQQVNDKGQIDGGLKGFYETELEQIREFLAVESAQ